MFLYSHWRNLSLSTRIVIANALGIAKIGPTHVSNNVIESDGYKIDDVERALNVDKLQEYTGSDSTDMQVLFDLTVVKAEEREPSMLVNEENTVMYVSKVSPTPKQMEEIKLKNKVVKKKKTK